MIKDEEDLIFAIRDHIRSNLNTKISAINTEKNDSLTLDTITTDDNHYIVGDMVDIPNHIFVFIALREEEDVTSNQSKASVTLNLSIEIGFADNGDQNRFRRSMRYMRALRETVLEFESPALGAGEIVVTDSLPFSFKANSFNYKVSGVNISVTL